jgi:hypothetical protein
MHQTNANETNKTNRIIVKEFIRAPCDVKLNIISEFNDSGP